MSLIFFCFLMNGPLHLQDQETVNLKVPYAPRFPTVRIDNDSNIWYASYWDHAVYKLNKNGEEIFRIQGPGKGPGEIEKPYTFALVEIGQKKRLILSHQRTKITMFDAKNGEYIRDISKFYPVSRLWQWDEEHVLALVDPRAVGNDGFELLRLSDGEVTKRWFRLSKPESIVNSSCMAFAMNSDRTCMYYQMGTAPQINVIKPYASQPAVWKLKPPPGYREPPSKPLPEKDRYSRIKVDAFHNSFTKVQQFAYLGNQYLLVNWKNPGEESYSFQTYDIKTQSLLPSSVNLRGSLLHTDEHFIYTLERIDTGELDDEPEDMLHRYPYSIDLPTSNPSF